jgi:activating signal cointegrator complex subunit 3
MPVHPDCTNGDNWQVLQGIFNFRPAVRPVPLEAHIQGFPGKFYCPRMATMNKPTYAAIQSYSPSKPVLVFVSSRRQTRLTALDIIAFAAADMRPSQWLHMSDDAQAEVLALTSDPNLRHTLQFGVGLHHAGLSERDRELVERLFCRQQIQVLVATSTLAWGVNTPAHLVIIKGTEYFDAPTRRCEVCLLGVDRAQRPLLRSCMTRRYAVQQAVCCHQQNMQERR